MNKRTVNIILEEGATKPFYATEYSAGADLRALIEEDITLLPNEIKVIPTGVKIELPTDSEAQIRSRSGMVVKHSIEAKLGTIDADYQGNVGMIIHNMSDKPFTVTSGDRLAQIVLNGGGGLYQADWKEVKTFDRTSLRGEGGYGHTGKK